jgi:hypothetical protein
MIAVAGPYRPYRHLSAAQVARADLSIPAAMWRTAPRKSGGSVMSVVAVEDQVRFASSASTGRTG